MKYRLPLSIQKRIGRNISYSRKKLELTQEEMSDFTGFSVNYISLVENGHRALNLGGLLKIAEFLETRPGSLMDEELTPNR